MTYWWNSMTFPQLSMTFQIWKIPFSNSTTFHEFTGMCGNQEPCLHQPHKIQVQFMEAQAILAASLYQCKQSSNEKVSKTQICI